MNTRTGDDSLSGTGSCTAQFEVERFEADRARRPGRLRLETCTAPDLGAEPNDPMNMPVRPNCRVFLSACGRAVHAAWMSLALVLVLAGFGCQSFNSPPSTDLASVKIQNRSLQEIQTVTVAVFKDHYFEEGPASPGRLVFTRPGSKWNDVAYGDFMDEKVIIRVEVTIVPQDPVLTIVACNAQVVSNAGDDVLEEDNSVHKFQKGPYQDLLNEIQTRLK
jgi:hypothetical protein